MTVHEAKELDELLKKLEQRRDELNVQMHLGKAEAKDLWQETEDKWPCGQNTHAASRW